ncbi:PilZ domain-containing protein [Chitinimonas sp. PSY-7]|uniref:PilZ domain-containing protein n=1 Tax=Chitinimonas sp. PSY-7 TaxID=3459088 RepID=UPI0040402CBC
MPTHIKIHADLPLAWYSDEPQAGSDGILLLRVLALLEAAPPNYNEDDSVETLRWQGLEARVDLCMMLLGQLLLRDGLLPDVCPVELSGEGASWTSPGKLSSGQHGTLALYLSPRIPQPLLLPASLTDVQQKDDGSWLVQARFELGDLELQDWLDKTIFRRHRREIFERKHAHDDE